MIESFLNGRVIVKIGDITVERVDAIVNAANSSLMGGGGVDGAIHRAGGPEILAECKELRRTKFPDGLPTGKAVITTAGRLPAKYVIHTVGPIYGRHHGREAELLKDAYVNSLTIAVENGLTSVAFPAISTGIYGYPLDKAACVSSAAISDFLQNNDQIDVRLVVFSGKSADTFLRNQCFSATGFESD